MPYPWAQRIATYAGDIDIGLNSLAFSDLPDATDLLAVSVTEFGARLAFGVGCPDTGDTSIPAPGFPDYLEVGGLETTAGATPSPASKGMKKYGTYSSAGSGSFTGAIVIDDKVISAFGGRNWDISASAINFGVESYWYWIDAWDGFTGGTVTEAMPTYRHILVDWGNDSMNREVTYYHDPLPCPTAILSPSSDVPYAIYIEQHISTNDPNDFNPRLLGWIVGPDYAEDELLQTGLTSVNVCKSDDSTYVRWRTNLLTDENTLRSDQNLFDCWSHFYLSEAATSTGVPVLVRWKPVPLYTSVGVVGEPDQNLYLAYWQDIPGAATLSGVGDLELHRATSEGWITRYFYTATAENWSTRYLLMLTTPSHTSWQKLLLHANDTSACFYLASGVAPSVYVDRNNRWIFHWPAGNYSSSFENAENDITDLVLEEAYFYAEVSTPEWNGFVCPIIEPTPTPLPGDGVAVDEQLQGTGSLSVNAWGFSLDGHDFYVIKLGTSGTIVYDLATGQWSEWASPGASNLRVETGMNWLGMGATSLGALGDAQTKIVAGDDTLGVLWTLDPAIGYDEHVTTLVPTAFQRVAIGGIPMRLRETTKVGGAYLTCSVGDPQLSGAEISLETSDDYGQTFQAHGTITTTVDDFTQEIAWRSIGLIKAPGRIFRIIDNGASVRLDSLDLK